MFWCIAVEYFWFLLAVGSLVGSCCCIEPQRRVQRSAHGAEGTRPTLCAFCGLGISLGLGRVQGVPTALKECLRPTLCAYSVCVLWFRD